MACRGILVVEDDDDIRESVKQLLEYEGFTVHTAQNGKEALDVIHHVQAPCLILLDLMMPVMNGWEFLEAQGHDHLIADIPVVVATAAENAKARPIKGLLRKPIDVDELIRVANLYCPMAKEQTAKGQDRAA